MGWNAMAHPTDAHQSDMHMSRLGDLVPGPPGLGSSRCGPPSEAQAQGVTLPQHVAHRGATAAEYGAPTEFHNELDKKG